MNGLTLERSDAQNVVAVYGRGCCDCSQTPVKPLVDDDVGGRVAYQDITVSIVVHAEHLVLADNESFLMPIDEDGNARPIYPA